MKSLAALLALVTVFALGSTAKPASGAPFLAFGKYSRTNLRYQWSHCSYQQCDKMMRALWPEPVNPFDDGESVNCNGVLPSDPAYMLLFVPRWFQWSGDAEFTHFAIWGSSSTLAATVEDAWQRLLEDYWCDVWLGGQWWSVWGAYLTSGTQIGVQEIKDQIPGGMGYGPPGPSDPWGGPQEHHDYFGKLHDHVATVVADPDLGTLRSSDPWYLTYHGAARYLGDLLLSGGPVLRIVAPTDPQVLSEIDFAELIFVVSLVTWQAWEGGQQVIDLIGPAGLTPWRRTVPSENPRVMWYIQDWLHDLLYIPVDTEKTTWGSVKSRISR
jgi:hypothetical protein